ncbi:MAG: hypothetical protein CMO55_18235 [Verrucomicrobiales bacterium]|nr:hypothetical protein [Verrucomicrobiales bacterium]
MLFRVVVLVVVLFWLGSIGWLCAVIWAPPESRMAKVDPREVFEVFFAWNDSTTMVLVENGQRRGQLTVSGGSGTTRESKDISKLLSVTASFEHYERELRATVVDVFLKLAMDFSEALAFQQMDLSARVPSRGMTAHLELGGKPLEYRIDAVMGEQQMLDVRGRVDTGLPPIPTDMLPMGSLFGDGAFDPREIKWDVEARMGRFAFGGREQRAYLLIFTLPDQGQSMRVYLSEVGEPLQIETDVGFEAISEILVPLDYYRAEGANTEDD